MPSGNLKRSSSNPVMNKCSTKQQLITTMETVSDNLNDGVYEAMDNEIINTISGFSCIDVFLLINIVATSKG